MADNKRVGAAIAASSALAAAATYGMTRPVKASPPSQDGTQEAILQQLTRMGDILEGIAATAGVVGAKPLVANIPMSPETLNQIIVANRAELVGKVGVMHYQYAIACPAGATTVFARQVPLGWVGIFITGSNVELSLYNPLILVSFTMAGEILTFQTPCISRIEFPFALYRPLTEAADITLTVVNGSPFDTILIPEFIALYLEKSYYQEVYLPLVRKFYRDIITYLGDGK